MGRQEVLQRRFARNLFYASLAAVSSPGDRGGVREGTDMRGGPVWMTMFVIITGLLMPP